MNNNEVICNFLVRDNEIEELKKNGYESFFHIATNSEYLTLLYNKIIHCKNMFDFYEGYEDSSVYVCEIFDLLEQYELVTKKREMIDTIRNYVFEKIELYEMDLENIYEVKARITNMQGNYNKRIVLDKYWENPEIHPEFIAFIVDEPYKYYKKIREAVGFSIREMVEFINKCVPKLDITEEEIIFRENPKNFKELTGIDERTYRILCLFHNEDIFKEVAQLIEEVEEMIYEKNSSSDNEVFYYYKKSLENLARKNNKCNVNK